MKLKIFLLNLVGVVLFFFGLWLWGKEGFHFDGILAAKSSFFKHPLHISIAGVFVAAYASIENYIKKISPVWISDSEIRQ